MPSGLRNEDYVAYLDESGEAGLQVVSGVLIPTRWLRPAERRWKDFIRHHLGSRSGRREIHARELLRGEGASYQAQAAWIRKHNQAISVRAAGRDFYREALQHIASIAEVRVLSVGLKTKHPVDTYRLWFWLAYACLVERARAPRPRLAFTVIDGTDVALRHAHDLVAYRFYRAFPRCQPYVGSGNAWFIGGSAHHDSALMPFVQMADLVAAAARHRLAKRQPYRDWYKTHLTDFGLSMGRDVDVSTHALDSLRGLSPKDRCESGFKSALIP